MSRWEGSGHWSKEGGLEEEGPASQGDQHDQETNLKDSNVMLRHKEVWPVMSVIRLDFHYDQP